MNLIPQRWDRRKEAALPCAKSQVSMRCTGEFMADSCSVSQNPRKKEAGAETKSSFQKLGLKHSKSQKNYLENVHPMKIPSSS